MKTYLGDGAYAELDECGRIVLTTGNGHYVTNRIVLEGETYARLLLFVDACGRLARQELDRRQNEKEPTT